ncbi:tRNA 2-selenouridine(34) synthase MnmH [Halalkalibacter alkalisediminis]|uniref:tRNA 2-selenouridine(34) synthase MnmH n=1 Tax=Halalkalibacter alkalisediminis TaxID=935616 RepID=A0ABV6NEC4_9BACI|nr:tRNA 2-selenouridine(34) synthase MnmH [Halalkalibacter alkalisediminis]
MTVQVKQISIEELHYEEDLYIDVRSPAEFAEYCLPNAINIPLFTNDERARVGTTYKQKSQDEAIELGLSLYVPKIETFYKSLKGLQEEMPNRRMVVYCWRGGMRSKTVAGTVGLLGVKCYQLTGGIRAFRKIVQVGLEKEAERKRKYLIVAGHTGSRKTEILQVLQNRGYPVIDLEQLAGHRGSVFGHIGVNPNSQKQFEYLLMKRLEEIGNSPYIIIEGESKRLGRVVIPDFILKGKENGKRVELVYPFWARVEHIYQTYQPQNYKEKIQEAIGKISKYLTHSLKNEIIILQNQGEYKQLFAKLLEEYYDPRYAYTFDTYQSQASIIEFDELDDGVEKLISFIEESVSR